MTACPIDHLTDCTENDHRFAPEVGAGQASEWERERARLRQAANGISLLAKACWQTSEDHGFHNVGQTPGDKLMLIVSEAAEALEDVRDGRGLNEYWKAGKDGTKPCGVPSELADIVIRVFDAAECWEIDLAQVILDKMEYNKSRPYLHGRTL